MKNEIVEKIKNSIECKEKLLNDVETLEMIEKIVKRVIECYKNGNRIYICGNGGSASDSQHFAAELVGRYMLERKAFPAQSFTTDTSILTAVGNDYGYDTIFERQAEAMCREGDILFGITTSGNSINVLKAFDKAKSLGATTIGLLGKDGGKGKDVCDMSIVVNYNRTPNIQETHIMIIHIICELVERELYEG